MRSCKTLLTLFLAIAILSTIPAEAQTETPIYSFKGRKDGDTPVTGLVFYGNKLFGTTFHGGSDHLGTVYRLKPQTVQTEWKKSVLHSFLGAAADDGGPSFSPVVRDKQGVLYGATVDNGPGAGGCCGVVFKLTPPATGETAWTETVIHAFTGTDGDWPEDGLTLGPGGVLYGATHFGGSFGFGCIFQLSPPASGQTPWNETVLYSFGGGTDGETPNGSLLLDKSGALLGTTIEGGVWGLGTAFVLTPPAASQTTWTKTSIHGFEGDATDAHDGAYPNAGLVGGVGQVFGTTSSGGAAIPCCGIVFELVQEIAGSPLYTLNVLHQFTGGQDGAVPLAGLFKDASGNMWGTTNEGGVGSAGADVGTIFRLSPKRIVIDQWNYSVAYGFNGGTTDGAYPESIVSADKSGNLYGTTSGGGASGEGTVYEFVP